MPAGSKPTPDLQRELREARTLLDLALRTGQMVGAIVDGDLRHTWIHNPAPEPSQEEILGRTDEELFPSEMAQPTTQIKRESLDSGHRVEREFYFRKPWGIERYRAAAEPLKDENGRLYGAAFAAVGLSDRYKLLERTSDAVFTVDTDWRVRSWNRVMAGRTGVSPESAIGRVFWDVGATLFGGPFPEELEALYRHAMQTREPVETEQYIPEPLGYWVDLRIFPDADGLSVFSRDISERVRRRRKLERHAFLFQRVQALSRVGIWEVDRSSDVVWWSEGVYRIHGIEDDYPLTVDSAIRLYHPDDRPILERAFRQAVESGRDYTLRLRIIRPTGDVRYVSVSGEAVMEADGEVTALRGTLHDVTKDERAKQALEARNRRLDQFAGIVSHDIRSPLSAAIGFTEVAQETGDTQHLGYVRTNLKRIQNIVDDLLVLAQGRTSSHLTEDVCMETIARQSWEREEMGELHLNMEGVLGTVRGHPGLLGQMFCNLFRNARQHAGPGVTVTIGLSPAGGFFVEDDGPGIPDDIHKHILEHGFSTSEEGTGFGLSIVAEIAATHGWTLSAERKAPDGARFAFAPLARAG